MVGLHQTVHMSILAGQDIQICLTGPAGLDWIRTYVFKNFTYQVWVMNFLKIRSLDTNLVSTVLLEKEIEKKNEKKELQLFKSVESPASGNENVWFPDSPDFENFPDRLDIMSGWADMVGESEKIPRNLEMVPNIKL